MEKEALEMRVSALLSESTEESAVELDHQLAEAGAAKAEAARLAAENSRYKWNLRDLDPGKQAFV